jgi:hypothetical protein
MSELDEDFRSTAENIAQDAQAIKEIEDEKARLDPADPRATSLSALVEEMAEQLHHKSPAQRDLAETARDAG